MFARETAVLTQDRIFSWIQQNSWLEALVFASAAAVGYIVLISVIRRLQHTSSATRLGWDDVVVTAVRAPLQLGYWLAVLMIAWQWLVVVQFDIATDWADWIPQTTLLFVGAWTLHRLIIGFEAELIRSKGAALDSTAIASIHAVAKLTRVILWILVILTALQGVGVSVSGLLAFGGIGGIAVGFAAKDLLSNFFGGMSIYLDRPFAPGDWIRSPDREIEGTVEDIGWRLTRIRTFDQRPLYIPNSVFSQISVENPSRMRNRRIYETIGLRYQDSAVVSDIVARVHQMILTHEEIDTTRTLIVNFNSFGPSSLDFFIYTFTKTTDWVTFHAIKQDIMLRVLKIIHEAGADIALPTQTLHWHQGDPSAENLPSVAPEPSV